MRQLKKMLFYNKLPIYEHFYLKKNYFYLMISYYFSLKQKYAHKANLQQLRITTIY